LTNFRREKKYVKRNAIINKTVKKKKKGMKDKKKEAKDHNVD